MKMNLMKPNQTNPREKSSSVISDQPEPRLKRILLAGNPNVGKSVIFTRLTGVQVITSNYPGTTIEYMKGYMRLGGEKVEIIDSPGTYSLDPSSRAEEVTTELLDKADIIVNVIDSTNLERNLNLTLQLIKRRIPLVIDLNLWDETKHIGIHIDRAKLQDILGVPVVTTCALTGEGIKYLHQALFNAQASQYTYEDGERWHDVGNIVEKVQKITHRHHTMLERLGDLSIKPATGLPLALVVMLAAFWIIRLIGEGLIGYLFEPLFTKLWAPLIIKLSGLIGPSTFIHGVLIGDIGADGTINFVEALGLLTTGLYVPVAMILPYIFAFYLILSLMEDLGYLPRLSVLVDTFMHRLGLHGFGVISMMLALGCNVPGMLSTRILETRREKFIAATLMSISIPCMAQIAVIIGLVGRFGIKGLLPVFGSLFMVWIILGFILNLLVKGESPEIFLEIPPYRLPYLPALLKKLLTRTRHFLAEAVPLVILGILVINILHWLGIMVFLARMAGPVFTTLLGLPGETAAAMVIGFLRKDVAVGMLSPLNLSLKQLVIASVMLAMYFPCMATFVVMIKELGLKDMLKSMLIMISSTLLVGTVLNILL